MNDSDWIIAATLLVLIFWIWWNVNFAGKDKS
jgi:hypothetical protein